MECSHCFHDELNSSRIRIFDIFQLVVLRVPMRCSHCYFRQFKNVFSARAYKKQQRALRKAA
jgi:hypothetical protein